MKLTTLAWQSTKNALRSKSRTALTVVAIFIGAFTLTITSGIGIGVNRYIDDSIASIGAEDALTVTKLSEEELTQSEGPQEYVPNQVESTSTGFGPDRGTATVAPLTADDLDALRAVTGVRSVEPVKPVTASYIQGPSEVPYAVQLGAFVEGMELTLAAGAQVDDGASEPQLAVAESYLDALGFATPEAALGQTVTLGYAAFGGATEELSATVVAVTLPGFGPGADNAVPNRALIDALYAAQSDPEIAAADQTFASATLRVNADMSSPERIAEVQADLEARGYGSTSIADQLGTFTAVIDAIVLILNAFAIIALVAAGFGIVNTLMMSLQERTREIGLMKAMGMPASRVFLLFSFEAIVIGLLGSGLGIALGMLVGSGVSGVLSRTLFSGLAGLNLVGFTLSSVLTVLGVVVAIALAAGALPALRAARNDPIESLRYE